MNVSPAADPNASRDEGLAQLLAELTEQVRQGQQPNIEAVARQHPDLAIELRELWARSSLPKSWPGLCPKRMPPGCRRDRH